MTQPRVIVTRLLFWSQGFCLSPGLVFLRPERRDDDALLAHEKVHCEQMLRVGWLAWWWRYLTDEAFRFDAEVQAYRRQAELRPQHIYIYAMALATRYRLDVTYEEALAALSMPARETPWP